jgi:hypothetical protein
MKSPDSQQDSVSKELTRKAYEKPRLEVYGDLGEITRALNSAGRMDSGISPTKLNVTA